jgi:hypothetical protein
MLLFQSCRPGAFVFLDWPASGESRRDGSQVKSSAVIPPVRHTCRLISRRNRRPQPPRDCCDPIKAARSLAVASFAPR